MKNKYRISFFALGLLLFLSWPAFSFAQEMKPTAQKEEVLTNQDVVTLTKVGLSSQAIIGKIRGSKTQFNLSTDELMRLKQEKVADDVIEAMLDAANASAGRYSESRSREPTPAPDPNDPMSEHDSGIYAYTQVNGKSIMTLLEPTVASKAKTSGIFKSAITYGIAKAKIRTSIRGSKANVQLNVNRPVFYFYFEVKNAGLSATAGYATSPKEFILVQLTPKKDAREVTIGEANAFGASMGTMDKDVRGYDYEKVGPGVYKVTINVDLKDGEYGFYQGGAQPGEGGKIFDFGIRLNP